MQRCLIAFVAACCFPVGLLAESPDLASIDPVMGNWEGEWSDGNSGAQGTASAKIIARGSGNYSSVMTVEIDGASRDMEPLKLTFKDPKPGQEASVEGKVKLSDEYGGEADLKYVFKDGKWEGTVANDQINVTLNFERVHKKGETLGAKPPAGAVVLFDGTDTSGWTTREGGEPTWKILDGGAMQVATKVIDGKSKRGDLVSKEKFTDHKLHVEFRTPFMPLMRGQARGNSGVYVGGTVEVQVLDSFGEPAKDNEAGGIYQVAVPKSNASLPPGEWQCYDIEYHPPTLGDDGKVTEPGEITVTYNGEVIHDKVVVKEATKGGLGDFSKDPMPLLLQDHGNPVEYRNIWVEKIGPKKKVEPGSASKS